METDGFLLPKIGQADIFCCLELFGKNIDKKMQICVDFPGDF